MGQYRKRLVVVCLGIAACGCGRYEPQVRRGPVDVPSCMTNILDTRMGHTRVPGASNLPRRGRGR